MNTCKLLAAAMSLALAATVNAKTLTIGIDISESNPLVVSEAAAKAAAEHTKAQVSKLELGDTVRIRTFGDRQEAHPTQTIRITRGNRADKVAATVARYIATLPAKKLASQGTNIVAFLEFGQFDCQAGGAQVLLLTDGVESSAYVDPRSFLAGKAALPTPESTFLKGCDVTMFGFGQNSGAELPPQIVKTMRASWTDWMKKAGANSFTAIIDP